MEPPPPHPPPPYADQTPTFSIQIPFILAGTRSIPEDIYNHAERRTRPISAIQWTLNQYCQGVKTSIWAPSDVTTDISDEKSKSKEKVEAEDEDEEEDRKWKDISNGKWVIRHGAEKDESRRRGWVGSWRPGDGVLSEKERRALGTLWNVPVVLQRLDVPITRLQEVMGELGMILHVLHLGFNGGIQEERRKTQEQKKKEGNEQSGKDKVKAGREEAETGKMRIVCNDRCQVKMSISPGRTEELRKWDVEEVEKVLLILVGFERELMITQSMSSVLHFFPLSRFMTHFSMCALRKEKKDFMKAMASQKRTAWSGVHTSDGKRDNFTWEREVNVVHIEDIVVERGLWMTADKMRKERIEQGQAVSELLKSMADVERSGKRMGVAFRLTAHQADIKIKVLNDKKRYEEEIMKSFPMSPSTPAPPGFESFPGLESIVFQNQRSSLNIEAISAYSDLIISLIDYALSNSYATLRLQVESYRTIASDLDETPLQTLNRLFTLVSVHGSTRRYYNDLLTPQSALKDKEERSKELDEVDDDEVWMPPPQTPFDGIVRLVERQRERDFTYMPTCVERYADAGGFDVVPRKKLNALLLVAEEDRRKAMKAKADRVREGDTKNMTAQSRSIRPFPNRRGFGRKERSREMEEERILEGSESDIDWGVGGTGPVESLRNAVFSEPHQSRLAIMYSPSRDKLRKDRFVSQDSAGRGSITSMASRFEGRRVIGAPGSRNVNGLGVVTGEQGNRHRGAL